VPFWIPPGLSLIYLEAFDARLANYTEPRSVNQRTLTVSPTVTPMYYG
jgi:hypothetical protein